ncbi:hypothetical protein OSTOST_18675 [Ostertagia ostertagi]
MTLLLFANKVAPVLYEVYYTASDSGCPAGDSKYGHFLYLRNVYIVWFDKTSRLILKRSMIGRSVPYVGGGVYVEYNGPVDPKDLGIGVFITIIRTGRDRDNENVIMNGKLAKATLAGEDVYPPSGKGSDFSRMYFEYPYNLRVEIIERKKQDDNYKNVLLNYNATRCAETDRWIANQGYYKLNEVTGVWTPVYYDPTETDFYYR